MRRLALIACTLAAASTHAAAGPTCSPSEDSARILSSASPNAIHRDWRGANRVGMGWSLQVEREARDAAGTSYYVGDLYDTRGQLANRNVFVIESEWDCGP